MFILGEMIKSFALLISLIFNIVYFLLVIRIILSWVGADPYSEMVSIVYRVTDPILAPLKRLPLQAGMMDFSPIVAFLLISVAKNFIVNVLYHLAARLG
ncbi:MAG: YggT family protein [Candidatus Omnitrophota bacterium]